MGICGKLEVAKATLFRNPVYSVARSGVAIATLRTATEYSAVSGIWVPHTGVCNA